MKKLFKRFMAFLSFGVTRLIEMLLTSNKFRRVKKNHIQVVYDITDVDQLRQYMSTYNDLTIHIHVRQGQLVESEVIIHDHD